MFVRDPATAKIGEEILPFEMGYLPEFFQKKAEIELHDTPTRRSQGLRQIRLMAKSDKQLKNCEFNDDFLIQFLRAKKYDVARAFSVLKKFINYKKKISDSFTNFRFDVTIKTVSDKLINLLPWRCQDGCAIILIELDNWIPEEFPVEEVKRVFVLFLLQSLRDPMTQVNGFKVIIDVKSNPTRHLRYATPSNLHHIYYGIQHCVPGRYKEVHIVNLSVTFRVAYIIIRPFISEKMKKRVFLHSSTDELLKYFPRSVLPTQYGGDLSDYNMTDWVRKVMAPEELKAIGAVPAAANN